MLKFLLMSKTKKNTKTTVKKVKTKKTEIKPVFEQDYDQIKSRLIEILKEKSCFEGDIILPSGRIDNHYFDIKETILSAEGGTLASLAVMHHLHDDVNFIGGPSGRAYSLSSGVSQLAYAQGKEINAFIIRKEPKRHCRFSWIEGPLVPEAKVCIVQDVVVDGERIIETIRRLEEECRVQIVQVIGLLDRLDGSRERLEELCIDYTAICTVKDILPGEE